jgi:hypothetical protein
VQDGQHLAGSAVREQCYALVSHGRTNACSVSDGLYVCVAVTVLQTPLRNQEPAARFACDRSPFLCKACEDLPYCAVRKGSTGTITLDSMLCNAQQPAEAGVTMGLAYECRVLLPPRFPPCCFHGCNVRIVGDPEHMTVPTMEVQNILRNQVFAPQSAYTRQQANYPEGHTIPTAELYSVCTYHDHHAHTHCPSVGTKLKVGTKATLYSDAVSDLPDAPVVAAAIPQGEQLNGPAAADHVRLRIAQTTHHAQPSAQQCPGMPCPCGHCQPTPVPPPFRSVCFPAPCCDLCRRILQKKNNAATPSMQPSVCNLHASLHTYVASSWSA